MERAVLVQPSVYGTDNRCLLEALAGHRNRLRGIAALSPGVSDAEFERIAHIGVRGLRYNLVYKSGVRLDDLETLARRIEPLDWHLELLVNPAELPKLAPRLIDLPVDFVIEAMGYAPAAGGVDQPAFKALLRLLRSGRCWVKLSGVYRISSVPPTFRDAEPLVQALIETDPTRIVWGTGWPHPDHYGMIPNDGDLLDLLGDWVPDERLRHLILVDNPARLYGFDD
jgi:predicted TIM-barrel fold metal-dependent hydrolase